MTQHPMPTLDLVREVTDRAVLDELFAHVELTRADIAARTSLSKPTVSESMRRLESAGLVVDAGAAVGGRGRAGRNYRLTSGAGSAIAMCAGPDGVRAEVVDLHGRVVGRATEDVPGTLDADHLSTALRRVAEEAAGGAPAPVRATSVSVADPYDQSSGRLVHLPDSPFLTGEFSPSDALGGLDLGEVVIDNDVNWAALAELDAERHPTGHTLYVYLGEGIGAASVVDGAVARGHRGLAGELAQTLCVGPQGRAMRLVRVFPDLGLTRRGSVAIDVPALRRVLSDQNSPASHTVASEVVTAVSSALASAAAMANPGRIVLAGPWHDAADLVARVADVLAASPLPTPVVAATIEASPLLGARMDALGRARALLLAA